MIKELLEATLEGEMEAHIAESHELDLSPRRNGKTSKLMKSTSGVFDLETPRDRDASFEPEIVKKRQTVLNESLDNKVLALYKNAHFSSFCFCPKKIDNYRTIGHFKSLKGSLN